MSIFKGVNEAKVFESGRKLPEGDHKVRIEKILLNKSARRAGADLYIVEMTCLESSKAEVGGRYSWVQDMSDQNVAFPQLKQFALACLKADKTKDASHYAECESKIDACLEASVSAGFFNGSEVGVSVLSKKTRNNRDFLAHTFRKAA